MSLKPVLCEKCEETRQPIVDVFDGGSVVVCGACCSVLPGQDIGQAEYDALLAAAAARAKK